ncbi:MAG: hypothetical protein ABSH20_14265 [Tepidisphaeraceae bacterium]|jgi:hypothetical protein
MLKLRPEQYDALVAHSFKGMETRIAAALKKLWPVLCATMGDAQLRRSVRQARVSARSHGIRREADILRFSRLMLAWGDNFNRSSQTPWAAQILAWRNCDAPTRLDALEGRSEVELRRRPELSKRLR